MSEVIPLALKTATMRNESRILPRLDYPYVDNKHWLKLINFARKRDSDINWWLESLPPMIITPESQKSK